MLKDNLEEIENRIAKACERAGRSRSEVLLLAVSKTKPAEMIREAYDLGVRAFGENHPQEIRDKAPVLPDDIDWHMIGHLQTNKIKYVIDRVCMIHSIDSLHLAEAVSKEAVKRGLVLPVLVEVNMAQEESKGGIAPNETEQLIRRIAPLPGIRVEGLMTIAPITDEPETNRIYFHGLKKLSVDINAKNIDNVDIRHLSMGMTGDFEVAVEEGATIVRVGTGIFGARSYQNTEESGENGK